MATSFNSLPSELQQMVFNNLNKKTSDIRQCVLVCKSWQRVYQRLLYMRVELGYQRLLKFTITIENNHYLGSMVQQLKIYGRAYGGSEDEDLVITKLFSHLHNLERIECSEAKYYTIILDSLLVNDLPHLKFIAPPSKDIRFHDYISCVIYLRDRLQTLAILESTEGEEPQPEYDSYDNYPRSDEEERIDEYGDDIRYRDRHTSDFNRLFNRLNQFKNLKTLHIEKECRNVINLIEETVQRCSSSIQQLRFELDLDDYISHSDSIINLKGPPAPLLTVNNAKFDGTVTYNSQMIQYIMLKFPQVETFKMRRVSQLNESIFNKFMDYLTKIKHVQIDHIPFKQSYVDPLALLWTSLSQSHLLSFDIRYGCYNSRKDHVSMVQEEGLSSNIICFEDVFKAMKHVNLIFKHGHIVDHLTFHNVQTEVRHGPKQLIMTPYHVLIYQPLKYCPKLKQLSIHGSTITEVDISAHQMIRKETFDLLRLSNCTLGSEAVMEKLSVSFASIKHVEISQLTCKNSDPSNRYTPSINFNMIETDIGTLSLTHNVHYYDRNSNHVVLVKTSIQQCDYYYVYDFSYMNGLAFKQIDEEAYNDECNGYSTCKPKPEKSIASNLSDPYYLVNRELNRELNSGVQDGYSTNNFQPTTNFNPYLVHKPSYPASRQVNSNGINSYSLYSPNATLNAGPYPLSSPLYQANSDASIGSHNEPFQPTPYQVPHTMNNSPYQVNRDPSGNVQNNSQPTYNFNSSAGNGPFPVNTYSHSTCNPNLPANPAPFPVNNSPYPEVNTNMQGRDSRYWFPPTNNFVPHQMNSSSYPVNRESNINTHNMYGSNPSGPYNTNNNLKIGHPAYNSNNHTFAVNESERNNKQKDNRRRFIIHVKCRSLEKLLVKDKKTLRLTIV